MADGSLGDDFVTFGKKPKGEAPPADDGGIVMFKPKAKGAASSGSGDDGGMVMFKPKARGKATAPAKASPAKAPPAKASPAKAAPAPGGSSSDMVLFGARAGNDMQPVKVNSMLLMSGAPGGSEHVSGESAKVLTLGAASSHSDMVGNNDSGSAVSGSRASSMLSSLVDSEMSEASQRPAKVVVGRTALPEAIALTTVVDCPKDDEGNFLSVGARLHSIGQCTPCKWLRSVRGCRDGLLCKLCHASHENLTKHGIRNIVRKHGLQRREIFESNQAQAMGEVVVKNTFIEVRGDDQQQVPHEEVLEDEPPKTMTRSRSQDGL